jgi:peptidoglycan/LPS O-acetylase OafA/YrhL
MLLLDCCRGIAAFLVVFQHSVYTVAKPKYFGMDPLQDCFLCGSRGVDFFFVLSGFVIAFVHWPDLGKPDRIGRYLTKRFVRVYPVLWAVAIPMICASWLISSEYIPSGWQDRVNVTLTSLTLLPSQLAPIPDVAWTLKHEVLFYGLYCLVLWRPRLGTGILLLWAGLCVSHLTGRYESNFVTDFVLSPYNLEFLLGVGCGWFMRNRRVRYPLLLCAIGLVGIVAAGVSYEPPPVLHPWIPNPTTAVQVVQFGISSALIILGLAQINTTRMVTPPKAFILLGSASYSIYLIHVPVISAACKILKKVDGFTGVDPLAAVAALCGAGVLAGIFLHLRVELPILKAARRILRTDNRSGSTDGRPLRSRPETLRPVCAIKEPV